METSESVKERKTHKDIIEWKNENKTPDKSDNTTGRNKSKDIGKWKEIRKIPEQV